MVDILYYDKPYYLAPAQAKEKAYFLFKEVLSETAHIAVGNFIMREREHMCLIESYKKGLLLITLNYPYEIRDINEVPFLKTETPLNKEELKLARELVGKFTLKTLDLSKYKDTFAEKLKELIMMDLRGKKLPAPKKPSKKSLMEALKASVK
jgi:DNA end-binding protein Ku